MDFEEMNDKRRDFDRLAFAVRLATVIGIGTW